MPRSRSSNINNRLAFAERRNDNILVKTTKNIQNNTRVRRGCTVGNNDYRPTVADPFHVEIREDIVRSKSNLHENLPL